MAASLSEFLATLPARKLEPGKTDCLLILADWVAQRLGVDPAAPWRGTYASEREYRALVKREGGMASLVSRALAHCGIRPTDNPEAGDIGLVLAPTAARGSRLVWRPVGAICIGHGEWALLTGDRGLVVAALPVVAAWGLSNG